MPDLAPSVATQRERFFGKHPHPYVLFEQAVERHLGNDSTIVDIGCGRGAPVLRKFTGRAARLVGVDLVPFTEIIEGIELHNGDIAAMPFLTSDSVDLVCCRSVMEHVTDPDRAYAEISRALKPGGHFIFLTANVYDYASLAAMLIPNRFHARIVRLTEGRAEEDTFPTAYKCNSRRKIRQLCERHGFAITDFSYLGQYPNYFSFNRVLHYAASLYEVGLRNVPALHFLRGWILADLVKRPG